MNDITLDVEDSSKDRMEYFLNSLNEKLEPTPYDWQSLKESNRIVAGYRFQDKDKTLTISLFFLDSYHDATEVASANGFQLLPNARWSQNGSVMYLVECADAEKVSDILSHFAGRE